MKMSSRHTDMPPASVGQYLVEAGVQTGLISGQSFVAGGTQSKAILDLLAERLQPNALLYMMSCHAGVCPRRTSSQTPESFQIEGQAVFRSGVWSGL